MSATIDHGAVDAIVADFGRRHRCPSISWGIVRSGELTGHGSFGTVGGEPPNAHTVYRIASMTKSFSAALTLLLRDEGVLGLDAPIGASAPELAGVRSPTADAPAITVRDLLCMSSGLVSDDPWADRHLDLGDAELDALVAAGLVFAASSGTGFEYSNLGFALLGRVVHRATGRRLQELVGERLLEPLGMARTTWVRPSHDDWARPMRSEDGEWHDELPPLGDGVIAPMGGLWSTVADLARWVSWLAAAFPARDDPDTGPLRRSSRREMQTPQRYAGRSTRRGVETVASYGYGLVIFDEPTHGLVVTHSGGLPGYGSNMRWAREGDLGLVALSNTTYAPMGELTARLHDALHDQGITADPAPTAVGELDDAARRLVAILNRWASGEVVPARELDACFADNVALDDAIDRRAAAAAAHGPITISEVAATSDAAARVSGTDAAGRPATVTFSLAPHLPRRIQSVEVQLDRDDEQ